MASSLLMSAEFKDSQNAIVEVFGKNRQKCIRPPWLGPVKPVDVSQSLQKYAIQFDSANMSLGQMRLKHIRSVIIDGGKAKEFEFAEPEIINGQPVKQLYYRDGRVVGVTCVYDDAWAEARKGRSK